MRSLIERVTVLKSLVFLLLLNPVYALTSDHRTDFYVKVLGPPWKAHLRVGTAGSGFPEKAQVYYHAPQTAVLSMNEEAGLAFEINGHDSPRFVQMEDDQIGIEIEDGLEIPLGTVEPSRKYFEDFSGLSGQLYPHDHFDINVLGPGGKDPKVYIKIPRGVYLDRLYRHYMKLEPRKPIALEATQRDVLRVRISELEHELKNWLGDAFPQEKSKEIRTWLEEVAVAHYLSLESYSYSPKELQDLLVRRYQLVTAELAQGRESHPEEVREKYAQLAALIAIQIEVVTGIARATSGENLEEQLEQTDLRFWGALTMASGVVFMLFLPLAIEEPGLASQIRVSALGTVFLAAILRFFWKGRAPRFLRTKWIQRLLSAEQFQSREEVRRFHLRHGVKVFSFLGHAYQPLIKEKVGRTPLQSMLDFIASAAVLDRGQLFSCEEVLNPNNGSTN